MATGAANTQNIRLGPCQVTWGGVDLGYTKGGVEVTVASTTHDTTVDQEGAMPVDRWIMSRTIQVKVPMAETTVDKLAQILATTGGSGTSLVSVTTGVGTSLRTSAKPLVLHPINKTDASEDFTVPLANTTGDMQFTYEVDNERIFSVTFDGFHDTTSKVLFTYGATS